ncbi:hypothetical protein SDC9_159155 [bioreactor metagenome]|uniref:Uncharacterized protein n=1 Tax=bioreactor metagenome TaxID=1076179 RepID=A0A645FC46_9ZZZZ
MAKSFFGIQKCHPHGKWQVNLSVNIVMQIIYNKIYQELS